MGNIFWRSFIGQESLAKAFWVVYVFYNILIHLFIAAILVIMLLYNQTPVSISVFTNEIAGKIVFAAAFPYTLFSAIAVWRCSYHSGFLWRLLARLMVVSHVIIVFILI